MMMCVAHSGGEVLTPAMQRMTDILNPAMDDVRRLEHLSADSPDYAPLCARLEAALVEFDAAEREAQFGLSAN